jgi:hypothetical protein
MVPNLSVEIWAMPEEPPKRVRETITTEITSTLKLDTEDVPIATKTFFNAESMVDQTTMIRVLTPLLDVLENHGYQATLRLVLNSESLLKAGLKEKEKMANGDHSNLITSGITTTVPKLSVKISVTVKVPPRKVREIKTTENTSTAKLVTEDVMLQTYLFSNAESMVDQITKTTVLKLW